MVGVCLCYVSVDVVCIHGPFFFKTLTHHQQQQTGLCHDLGHGPFSHAFEYLIERIAAREGDAPGRAYLREWKHEDMSLRLLDALIEVRWVSGLWGGGVWSSVID